MPHAKMDLSHNSHVGTTRTTPVLRSFEPTTLSRSAPAIEPFTPSSWKKNWAKESTLNPDSNLGVFSHERPQSGSSLKASKYCTFPQNVPSQSRPTRFQILPALKRPRSVSPQAYSSWNQNSVE